MEHLCDMMEKLETYANEELSKDKSEICTHELGEVIDMIKDCAEGLYQMSVYDSMKNAEDEEKYYQKHRKNEMYYKQPDNSLMMIESTPYLSDSQRDNISHSLGNTNETKYYTETRVTKVSDLEKYLQELSKDIAEIVKEATPEERAALKQKIIGLQQKI